MLALSEISHARNNDISRGKYKTPARPASQPAEVPALNSTHSPGFAEQQCPWQEQSWDRVFRLREPEEGGPLVCGF